MSSITQRLGTWLKSALTLVPGAVVLLVALVVQHALVFPLLLLAQALLAAGFAVALGYRLEHSFRALVLRRGVVLLVWLALYSALVALTIGVPMMRLLGDGSVQNAVLLSAGFLLTVVALIRLWPVFGLALLWDEAYPEIRSGSWIFTALKRTFQFGWHLTGDAREPSFGSSILVTISLLLLIVPALAVAGLYGHVPSELPELVLLIYALGFSPLAHLTILWRTERLLWSDEEDAEETSGDPAAAAPTLPLAAASAVAVEPPPAAPSLPLTASKLERDATLLNAAAHGNLPEVQALLRQGADPNAVPGRNDRDQRTPLMSAVTQPDLTMLRSLLQFRADPNLAVNGMTPLLLAVRDTLAGRPEAVLTLLANGADPTVQNSDGFSPLHYAAMTADPASAAMLLDAGAPLEALNRDGLTALAVAARASNDAVIQLLLERHAATDPARGLPVLLAAAAAADDAPQPIRRLLKARANVHATDKLGRSALHVAALHGHGEIVELLITAGANINLRDAQGVTALMEAARAGANRVLQRLVFRKPDASAVDGKGRNALHLACLSRQANADTVRALLGIGVDPETRNHDGKRPVELAAQAGRWPLVLVLAPDWPVPEAVAVTAPEALASELTATATEGERLRLLNEALLHGRLPITAELLALTPAIEPARLADLLPSALERDQADAVVVLLRHGLDLAAAESPLLLAIRHNPLPLATIDTLLQAGAAPGAGVLLPLLIGAEAETDAARRAHVEAIALDMIERGADLFASDGQRRSLLHHAAGGPWPRLLAEGLRRGLDPNQADARGQSPLQAAVGGRHPGAEPLLRCLLRYGADPERAAADGQTALGLALHLGRHDLSAWLRWHPWRLPARPLRDEDLPAAAQSGDLEAVRKLQALGIAIDAQDAQGCTALLRAAGGGHAALVESLLAQGAAVGSAAAGGATALTAAVSAHQDAIVTRLIAAGAEVDQTRSGGITPLMIAAALGADSIVQALLVRGADATRADSIGNTALHAIAQFAWAASDAEPARSVIERLLDAGGNLNARDHDGDSPLLLLLGSRADAGLPSTNPGLLALLKLLLARDADLGAQNLRGVSVLHAAAMHGLREIIDCLLVHGADPRRRDAIGRNAYEVAVLLGYVDLAARLKQGEAK
jgi:ankyrin repeat protein